MNLDLTRRWITRWEGRRAVAYDDKTGKAIVPGMTVEGNPTIGVGLNLLTAQAQAAIRALGLDYNKVLTGAGSLTDEQIDYCLTGSINSAIATARVLVPTFNYLPDDPALVLTDLAFNMGEHRLSEFVHMLQYVRMSKFVMAASELRNSEWFGQVGHRAVADVAVLGGTGDPEAILAA